MITIHGKPEGGHRQTRGLTLLEVMIAIGLIAVLAVLLLPVFKGVRESGDTAKCLSRLRVVGTLLQTSIAESNHLLSTRCGGDTAPNVYLWGDYLWKTYLSTPATSRDVQMREMLRCPSAPCASSISVGSWPWYTYGLNIYDPRGKRIPKGGATVYELQVRQIDNPASTVLIADSCVSAGTTQTFRIGSIGSSRDGIQLRHHGKAHILFFDGHIVSADRKMAEQIGVPYIYDAPSQ